MNSLELEIVQLQPSSLTMKVENDIFKVIQVNADLIQSIETSITDFKKWQEHASFKSNGNREIKMRNNVKFPKKTNPTMERSDEHNSKSRECYDVSEIYKFPDFRTLHMSPSINELYTNITAGSFGSVISSLQCNSEQFSSFQLNHKFVNNFYKSQLFTQRLSIPLTLSNVSVTPVLFKKIFSFDDSCVRSTGNWFYYIKALQQNITALLCKANICVDISSPNSIGANLMSPPAIKDVADTQNESKSEEPAVNGRVCTVNCHGDLKITLKNDCDIKNSLNFMITKASTSTKETQTSKSIRNAANTGSILRNETAFKNNYKSHLSTVIKIKNSENKLILVNKDQSRINMSFKINEATSAMIKTIDSEDKLVHANKDQSRIKMSFKINETTSAIIKTIDSEDKFVHANKDQSSVMPFPINEKNGTTFTVIKIVDSEDKLAPASKDQSRIIMPSKINETTPTIFYSENKLALANKDQSRIVMPSKINEENQTTSTVNEIVDSENKLALADKDQSRITMQSTATANKKRPAPDFDTHKTGEVKKQKTDESENKSTTTSEAEKNFKLGLEEHRDNTDPNWQAYRVNNISDALNFMMNQWHVSCMSDPHVDLTARFNNSQQASRKQKPSQQLTVSCTSLFDKKIDRVDNNLQVINKKIHDLYDEYNNYNCNYRAQCRINSLIQRYTKEKELLENEYANLCDVRHEVAQFYKFYNAQFITQYQKNENDCQRNAILRNSCSTFLGVQRKSSTIKLGQI